MKTKSAFVFVLLVASSLVVNSPAQTLGQVSSVTQLTNCPSHVSFARGMTCYTANVVSCANAVTIPLVFGYLAVTPPIHVNGTIVLLSGSGGSDPNADSENNFVTGTTYNSGNYPQSGYNVVEIAWGQLSQDGQSLMAMPWEDTTNNCGLNCAPNTPPHSVLAAACRPATFLKYIHDNFHSLGTGMCAQGFSGGSAATAYALAWYGASSWLDKVELLSGPVFSDIGQGCKVPAPSGPTVCNGNPGFCDPGGNSQTSLGNRTYRLHRTCSTSYAGVHG